MYKGKKIAVVKSCLNEEGKIGKGVKKIPRNIVDEVIVVDDGSTDNTGQEAKEFGATVIKHKKNLGAGAGYCSGYYLALKKGYDVIVEMAGDDQDVAEEIPRLLDPIIDKNYDYVHGSRWLKGGKIINQPWHRTIMTQVYSILFSIFCGKKVTDATNGFRAFKSEILKDEEIDLKQKWLNGYEMEPYFLYKVLTLGYKHAEVPVTKVYHKKFGKSTKMIPFKSWWEIFRPVLFLKLRIKK